MTEREIQINKLQSLQSRAVDISSKIMYEEGNSNPILLDDLMGELKQVSGMIAVIKEWLLK
mgnify:FL=1|tara:strand:- start:928 stop:1110 length:183 start_codon:yes stop_codon:yes gene_type:complete